jgi:hypothetical protein
MISSPITCSLCIYERADDTRQRIAPEAATGQLSDVPSPLSTSKARIKTKPPTGYLPILQIRRQHFDPYPSQRVARAEPSSRILLTQKDK